MISKNKQKLIHALERKKGRLEYGIFVAEGPKLVDELLHAGWEPSYVIATQEWWDKMCCNDSFPSFKHIQHAISNGDSNLADVVTLDELQRCSLQKTPQQVLALFPTKHFDEQIRDVAENELTLALDGVQDPGNLGTIVRLADWFGIHHVFCSGATADIYAPKAIQATMGAISRVKVHYVDLAEQLQFCSSPIYGTHLDGENLYEKKLTSNGVIVMGNEGKGISPEVGRLVNERLFIPPYPTDRTTVESLNVAIATAIVCAEFRRKSSL